MIMLVTLQWSLLRKDSLCNIALTGVQNVSSIQAHCIRSAVVRSKGIHFSLIGDIPGSVGALQKVQCQHVPLHTT